jgi:hypothetical protein
MKKHLTSLAIQEMQIKTILRFHFSPDRKAMSKKQTTTNASRTQGKGTLTHCWWECKLVQPLWKSVWRFCKKHKSRTTAGFCYTNLGHISKGM